MAKINAGVSLMHPVLRQLMELAEIDALLVRTREQLGAYPAMLAGLERSQRELADRMAASAARGQAAQQARREAERDTAQQRERERRYLAQQRQVRTEKELEAITHELELTRGRIDELESRGLEQLEIEELSAAEQKALSAELERQRAEHHTERERIMEQMTEKQERLARLEQERTAHASQVPDSELEDYELLNQRYPGSAAVPMVSESCGGCHWSLVANTQQRVRSASELVRCEHCRRFLYPQQAPLH